jgi:hypothetical protein
MKALAAVTLAILTLLIAIIAWHGATFKAYSRDFGTLSPGQFEALNARMEVLEKLARVSVVALAAADLTLIAVAARRRNKLVLGLSIALLVAIALFLLIARAAVGPAMIGSGHYFTSCSCIRLTKVVITLRSPFTLAAAARRVVPPRLAIGFHASQAPFANVL